MKHNMIIRTEQPEDHDKVEALTREAFYNMYMPGCVEHYLVRLMREHEDFIPELDFVAELDGKIIGNIMYTKAKLTDDNGAVKEILTFGPVSIHPDYQRKGYGKQMMEHSFQKAIELGYDTIVIFGSPANYVSRGFKSCKRFNVTMADGSFPAAMMVKELVPGRLDGRHFVYSDSPVMAIDEAEAEAYDKTLEKMEKKVTPSQEEFFIISNSRLQ